MSQIKGVTDAWKMSLLGAITSESYLLCSQMVQVVDALHDSDAKVQAAVQCFGKLCDPENVHLVADALGPAGAAQLHSRVGELALFNPANPTGSWQLQLSHPVAATVARRLLLAAGQQHDLGLCRWPFHTCLVQVSIDGVPVDTEDPHKIKLPREGLLRVFFVDLRPVPVSAEPLSKQQMSVLIAMLTKSDRLDPRQLAAAIDAASLNTVVDVLQRWGAASAHSDSVAAGGVAVGLSSHVASLRAAAARYGLSVGVKDLAGLVPAIRRLALEHYVTCDQLMELLSLLPYHASLERVELCCCFWARTVDRAEKWTDVMRRLNEEQQVLLAQRLGYCNIFNAKRPSLHYRLRMFRPDEHEIAWQLFNMAVDSPLECFTNVCIDGEPKKVNEGSSVWPVLKGSAKDGTVPTCTTEFDFTWPEEGRTDNKLIGALKEKLAAAKEALQGSKPRTSGGGTGPAAPQASEAAPAQEHAKSKLLAVPLRKGLSRPTSADPAAAAAAAAASATAAAAAMPPGPRPPQRGAPSPRAPRVGLSPEEREVAEGVVLGEDGQLRRRATQGAMKFFARVAGSQAPNVAARALYMNSKAKEEVGMFGYHISHGGGLLLDRTTSTRLKAPVAAVAAGAIPGGLASPWRSPSSSVASSLMGDDMQSLLHSSVGSTIGSLTSSPPGSRPFSAARPVSAGSGAAGPPPSGWSRLRLQHNARGTSGFIAAADGTGPAIETIPEQ